MKLDHLMWACPDLDAGIEQIGQLTGVAAEHSGSHRGLGTRNALMSLGDSCYLEIIAPDPGQSLEGNFGGRLAALDSPGLASYAIAESDLRQLKSKLASAGIQVGDVRRTTRETESSQSLTWDLLFVQGLPGAPFFIDWLDCVHPAKTSPQGCTLQTLEITLVEPRPLMQLLEGAGEEIVVLESSIAVKTATQSSPRFSKWASGAGST